MTDTSAPTPESPPAKPGVFKNRFFVRSWTSSVISNLGVQILAVSAAWSMRELTGSPDKVALVQSALLMPMLLFGLIAGSVVDTYDKRSIAIISLSLILSTTIGMTMLDSAGLITPSVLLICCFVVGGCYAFFGPAWQMSVREEVPKHNLAEAISLNSISFNLGRSGGPAIGGLLVALVGAAAGFAATMIAFIPTMLTFATWKPSKPKRRGYHEPLSSAVGVGLRYVMITPAILNAHIRGFLIAACASVMIALAPVIASDVLGLGASAYGALLGAFGLGSVGGALIVERVRQRFKVEHILLMFVVIGAIGCAIVTFSRVQPISMAGFCLTGFAYMGAVTLLNIAVQLACPQWVAARALTSFQSLIAGAVAIASAIWGLIAAQISIPFAVASAGGLLLLTSVLWVLRPIPTEEPIDDDETGPMPLAWPDTMLEPNEGPVVIEIRYQIDEENRAAFEGHMADLERRFIRIGFRDWTLVRSISQPSVWYMRYRSRTWAHYLSVRGRLTADDRRLLTDIRALQMRDQPVTFSLGLATRTVRDNLRPVASVDIDA